MELDKPLIPAPVEFEQSFLGTCRQHAGRIFLFLLPSWLSRQLSNAPKSKQEERNSPTAYLDGLRGLFSFLVFIRHFLAPWEVNLDTGYAQRGFEDDVNNRSAWKLPFLRLLYAAPDIQVFFLVSGFAISYRPLKLIRKRDFNALGRSIMSSVFRRPLRLFLPSLVTTLFIALATYLGFYHDQAWYDTMPGVIPRHPTHFDSLVLQLQDWVNFVIEDLTWPWDWDLVRSPYDSHLWTIPIQFRASMVVYLTLIGLALTRTWVRIALLVSFWAYSLQQRRWEMALFFAGVLLAERTLILLNAERNGVMPTHNLAGSPAPLTPSSRAWKKLAWRAVFVAALYMGSYPQDKDAGKATPSFVWLANLASSYTYWHAHSATLLVLAISNDPFLQRVFTTSLMRYMGNISFSLYLIHGPVLHMFGYSVVPAFLDLTGNGTTAQYRAGLLLALASLTPLVLWIADIFWRLVEIPCTDLVARVEAYCFI